MVFAAGLSVTAAVVPNIVGCSDNTPILGVAALFDMAHQGLDVAYFAFDMSMNDLRGSD